MGMETEYVLRFSNFKGEAPPRETLYLSLERALRSTLTTAPAESGRFVINGGAFSFEPGPTEEGGLFEMATPECRGPGQLLLYQKAQEQLLTAVLPLAQLHLEDLGYHGELGLIKNCRDAMGHSYGVQESYSVRLARGWRLLALRALALPLALVCGLPSWLLASASTTLGAVLHHLGLAREPRSRLRDWLGRHLEPQIYKPLGWLFDQTAFCEHREQATAFLASRSLLAGAGTLEPDGRYLLSERAPSLTSLTPRYEPGDRPLYRTTNLVGEALRSGLNFRPWMNLASGRGRLQLGCSEANLCPKAEFLKLGTTCLVFDLIESGRLGNGPILEEPLAAMKRFAADPSLGAKAMTRDGREMTALEIQRWYLGRAQAFLRECEVPNLEVQRVVRLWSQTLDALETQPSELFGVLDWVTKQTLLKKAQSEPIEIRKKIDLRYHELGVGYFQVLRQQNLIEELLDEGDVRQAMLVPPGDTPALARAQAMGRLAREGAVFSWDQAETGQFWNRKVIPFPSS